ncbi:hypothetical protein [Bradyrhizobium sp. Arg816]|uniref:hypothetical protein n=1 Tax=Bradyrhizobium sp. Arg816 TaxID=2998491 RepID=UPI00249DAB2F|nr:hypothetical protein [Bradyrhizobium sp. Arg816]MDI3560181.1 hypothetical protein [Bradyrhizobium sp. Arg816]
MNDPKDAFDKNLESFMLSQHADSIADYASRGRKFEAMNDTELEKAWVIAFVWWTQRPSDHARYLRETDFIAEISLRGKQPPLDLVRTAFDSLFRRSADAIERFEREDPERFNEMIDRYLHDIEAFTSERKRSQN